MKSIIQRMKQLWNMYRMTKMVNAKVNEFAKTEPQPHKYSGYTEKHPTTLVIKLEFGKKYPKLTGHDATVTIADSIASGYLEGYTNTEHGIDIDLLRLTTKGRKFVGKPFGFLDELLSSYSATVQFVFGGAVTTIVIVVWNIINTVRN